MSPGGRASPATACTSTPAKRHRRPHVDVRKGTEHATIDIETSELLAGTLPPRALRAVQALLDTHRDAALHAFYETLAHRFPGTLESGTEDPHGPDPSAIIDVVGVRVLSRYVVELSFADGATRVIDLEPLLWGEMFEPVTQDYQTFLRARVDPDAGTIVWPNGADLSPRTLYAESKPAVPA